VSIFPTDLEAENDWFACEIAKIRAEYPHWPDELVVRLARCNLAEAEGDLETVRRMVADATAEVIARVPWRVFVDAARVLADLVPLLARPLARLSN
jgi:hypothetical protein